MRAHVWVFDHSYSAITNENGAFVMPRVPAGTELRIMAWHEGVGRIFGKDGKPANFKADENSLNFSIKKP